MFKPILYSDCDGVLYDTIDTSFEIMRQNGVDMNNHEEIDRFFRHYLDWSEVFKKADVINDAIKKLRILKYENIFSDIIILTRLSGNIEEEKVKREIFSFDLPETKVITLDFGLSKADVVDAENNILVDDELKNTIPWQKANGGAILFKKNTCDFDNNIICDLLDIPKTKCLQKILKYK